MSMHVYEITLADRDNYLTQIENQIQSKRNLLLGKRRILEETVKQNHFWKVCEMIIINIIITS